jgi:hypothetical protein
MRERGLSGTSGWASMTSMDTSLENGGSFCVFEEWRPF